MFKKKREKLVKKSKGSISKKDFETFKFGVQRLKEFQRELKLMNTKNFPAEAASIRAKLKDVSQIPTIEKEMKTLRRKISGKYKPKKVLRRLKISPGVSTLVDTDFDYFLNDIKASLTKTIKQKESELNNTLKVDLKKRKQKFEEKYQQKVRTNLKKEVREKFRMELEKRLEKEKVLLKKQIMAELGKYSNEEIRKHEDKVNKKLEEHDKELKKEREKICVGYDRKKKELEELSKKHEKEYCGRYEEKNKKLEKQRRDFLEAIRKKNLELEELSKKQEERINERLKKKYLGEYNRNRRNLMEEYKKRLDAEANKKVRIIKSRLQETYNKKLRKHEELVHQKLKKVLNS